MDLKTNKVMVFYDVVFNEVSSCDIKGKTDLKLFSEDVASSEMENNISLYRENI